MLFLSFAVMIMQCIRQWYCFALEQVSNRGEAHLELNAFRRKHDCALVISGDSLEVHQLSMQLSWVFTQQIIVRLKQQEHTNNAKWQTSKHIRPSAEKDILCQQFSLIYNSKRWKLFWNFFSCLTNCIWLYAVLQMCLRYYEHEFVELACQCPAVVCCRCSPTQKAQIVTLLQQHTANRTCAIGKWWARQQRHVRLRLLPVAVGIEFLLKPVRIDHFNWNCTPPSLSVFLNDYFISQHDVRLPCVAWLASRYIVKFTFCEAYSFSHEETFRGRRGLKLGFTFEK